MATVRYGDVVPASEVLTLEERLKRKRAESGEEDQSQKSDQDLNTQPNSTKKRAS